MLLDFDRDDGLNGGFLGRVLLLHLENLVYSLVFLFNRRLFLVLEVHVVLLLHFEGFLFEIGLIRRRRDIGVIFRLRFLFCGYLFERNRFVLVDELTTAVL